MNKKLIYLFAVLVAGLFIVSACEQAVGRRVNNKVISPGGKGNGDDRLLGGGEVHVSCSCSGAGTCSTETLDEGDGSKVTCKPSSVYGCADGCKDPSVSVDPAD